MKRILWLAAVLVVPASILIACSGDDSSVVNNSDAGSGGDATVGPGTDSSTGQDSGPSSSDSGPHADSGPAVDPATCKDAGTAKDCASCCASAYPGAETKADAVAIACACIGPDAGGDGG
ncbi:MAG: hypothetical protein ABI551_17285, partial [Polyangiaceae bacterium]